MTRCRLCTTNDREGLIEQLAEEMWESRLDREMDGAWAGAGDYWHITMRQFAEAALRMLERER